MSHVVRQILTKVKVIEEIMQKTWVKLEELENIYKTLRAAKVALISYGGNYNQSKAKKNNESEKSRFHLLSVSALKYKFNNSFKVELDAMCK